MVLLPFPRIGENCQTSSSDIILLPFIIIKFQIKIVSDNLTFAKCVKIIKNRKELTDEKIQELEEVVMDSVKARAIIDASKASMGMDISVLDLMNIEMFATRVIDLADYRFESCLLPSCCWGLIEI